MRNVKGVSRHPLSAYPTSRKHHIEGYQDCDQNPMALP
jgi:hypothetical protein